MNWGKLFEAFFTCVNIYIYIFLMCIYIHICMGKLSQFTNPNWCLWKVSFKKSQHLTWENQRFGRTHLWIDLINHQPQGPEVPRWLPLIQIHHLVVSLVTVFKTDLNKSLGGRCPEQIITKSHIDAKKKGHAAFFETPLMRSISCWDFCQANWALPKTFVEDPAGNIARRLMSDIRYLFFSSELD